MSLGMEAVKLQLLRNQLAECQYQLSLNGMKDIQGNNLCFNKTQHNGYFMRVIEMLKTHKIEKRDRITNIKFYGDYTHMKGKTCHQGLLKRLCASRMQVMKK